MTAEGAATAIPRVIVFGDVFDDIIVTPQGDIRPDTDTIAAIERRAGGSAANAAAWLAHLGGRVDFFGSVNRMDADRHAGELAASGVTAHLVSDDTLPTGTIVVILQADRTRTMLTERGANALTSAAIVDRSLFAPGVHLHFTAYSVFSDSRESRAAEFAELIADATAAGCSVSVNPGSAGFIADHGADSVFAASRGATALIPNLDEGRALTGLQDADEVLAALLEHYPIVALTQGRGGVLAGARGHDSVQVDAIPVTPVDTTGAGDAFSAAFLDALLRSGPLSANAVDERRLRDAATAGIEAASSAVTTLGARP